MKAVNTAICSFGMSGRVFHAPFLYANPGFRLCAVWERTKKTAADKYPGIISYSTFEEMLADPLLELVIVNTPNYTHFEYARMALEAGKHAVVEKPFTVTVAEAEELIRLARAKRCLLSVYQNRRWDSDFMLLQQIVEKKRLGQIAEAELHFDRFNLALSTKLHKETPGPGTGLLYDLGSHLADQALLLFGKPVAVFADISIMRPHSKVPDYMEVLLYYENLRVRLKSGYLVKHPIPAFIIHGSKGSFLKPRADIQEERLQAGEVPGGKDWGIEPFGVEGLLHLDEDGKSHIEKLVAPAGNYMHFYNQLYRAIRENAALPVTADEGKAVIEIIELARQSSEEKRVILMS